ncbi:MAG TPA: Na+/H+ antiporter NhaA [Burkholderiales bacterium]|nr:Na+/H+ antiporter NhaA [Burkholderiales bacterium]
MQAEHARTHPCPPEPAIRVVRALREFLALESAGGILLAIAAVAALALANSPLAGLYERFLDTPVEVRIGALRIAKPLLLWVNDGLMAAFFFLVGLELKREVLEGELSDPRQVLLPALAAAAGMAVPAAVYLALNRGDAVALRGWAIPTATDIAFALGVLALLGARVPGSLKVFLLTLAILDDLGAIVIIAIFYTAELSAVSLAIAAAALAVLLAMNRRGVTRVAPYLMIGLVLWVSVLKSGVHATLAGVALAMFIPLRTHRADRTYSPLRRLENDLHPPVAYVILPLFAFANAGVSLAGVTPAALLAPVPLGIAAGLLFGKTLGVLGATWLAVKLGWARLPAGAGWSAMLGMALLCGVGFTMSLFIGGLAFEGAAAHYAVDTRLGILGGSLLSALAGYALLRAALPRRAEA